MELPENHRVLEFGAFRLDCKKKLVWRDQEVLPLTPKMVETLLALIEHSGQVVDKDVMMQRVWPDTFVEESNLTYNISILRRVLKSNDDDHLYIETVPKRGYRFVFPVKEVPNSGGETLKPSEQRSEHATDAQCLAAELGDAEHDSSPAGLTGPLTSAAIESSVETSTSKSLAWIAAGVFFLVSVVALPYITSHFRKGRTDTGVVRFSLALPERVSSNPIAVSPDGRWLAFTSATGSTTQLSVRALDALTVQRLPGTEGAEYPFWSPDSRSVGFLAGGKLKRVEVSGGLVRTLCDTGPGMNGTWNRDGTILFATRSLGLHQVSAADGTVKPVTTVDFAHQETGHFAPCFIPDGRHFLYYVSSRRKETRGIYLGSLDQPMKTRLLGVESSAVYVRPGYLLFVQEGALMAQSFEAGQLRPVGEAFPVAERVGKDAIFHGNLSVSDNGVLVYDSNPSPQNQQLVWVDRQGTQIHPVAVMGAYTRPWLSPDENRAVVYRRDATGASDLWMYEVASATVSPFTFDPADDIHPIWSPDGSRIIWSSNREGTFDLYQKAAGGSGREEPLRSSSNPKYPRSGNPRYPTDWSLDGRYIIYYEIDPKTKRDVWVLPLSGDQKPFEFLRTESNELAARLSSDGRWMAYTSDELGEYEIYVQSFPAGGCKKLVSRGGGIGPHWRRDGKELFYYAPTGKLMAVEVKSDLLDGRQGASFEAGLPEALFEFRSGSLLVGTAPYTVTADGQRFLLHTQGEESSPGPLTVVVNWAEGVKKN